VPFALVRLVTLIYFLHLLPQYLNQRIPQKADSTKGKVAPFLLILVAPFMFDALFEGVRLGLCELFLTNGFLGLLG